MALTNPLSSVSHELFGDLSVQGGQLGINWEASVTSDVDLWSLSPSANRYMLIPDAPRTITLPAVSDTPSVSECIPGHTLWITNLSPNPVNILTVVNQAAATVTTLRYLTAVKLTASDNDASGWRVVGQMSDTAIKMEDFSGMTLQDGYDNTVAATPEIILNNIQGGINLEDASTPVGELLTVKSNGGTNSYLGLGTRSDPNGTEAYLDFLGATSNQPGTFSVGSVSNQGRNSVAFVDSQTGYSLGDADKFLLGYDEVRQASGPTSLGTTQSAAFYITRLIRNIGVVRSTPVAVNLITDLQLRTVYDIELEVTGLDDTSDRLVNFKILATVRPNGASWVVSSTRRSTTHSPNITTSQRGTSNLSISGTNFVVTLVAPGPLTTTSYSYACNIKYTAHTGA